MMDQSKYGLPLTVIEKINAVFHSHPEVDKVVLYGSRAMGTHRTASDIDLTIISSIVDLTLLFKIENEIDDLLLPYKVDLSLMSKIDNPNLINHIHRVGITFYQK